MLWNSQEQAGVFAALSVVVALTVDPTVVAAQDRAPPRASIYFGANSGYAWGDSQARLVTDCNVPVGIYCAAGATYTEAIDIARSGRGSMRADGVLGGVAIGADLRIEKIIVGAEIDFSVGHVKGQRSGSGQTSTLPFNYTVGSGIETSWLSTARARFGYAVTRDYVVYGTVGVAFARLEVSQNYMDDIPGWIPGGSRLYANHADVKAGIAFGAGGEWMLSRHWSLKAEYLRIDFGSVASYGRVYFPSSPNITQPHIMSADLSLNIVRVGLNYRF